MDLCEARISESRAAPVSAPDGGAVGAFGIRGQVEHVAIAAGTKHDGISNLRFDLAGDQVTRHDPSRAPVDDDEIQHFRPWNHGYFSSCNLPQKRLICA